MIYIPYFILLSFLGIIIMSNIGNDYINRTITSIGLCIVAPLGLIPLKNSIPINFLGLTLHTVNQDSTGYYFTIAFTLTLLCGVMYYLSLKTVNFREVGFAFIFSGLAVTAVSSNDLIVVIILIQIIPIVSAIMVAMNNSTKSKRTAIQIVVVSLFGTLLFTIGADSYINITKDTSIQNLGSLSQLSPYFRYLMLTGLLILIATPPFSNWFIEELSVASSKSSIFLSIFTPKVALVLLIKMFAGEYFLLYVGILLTLYGLVFSLFTPNLRKILAYATMHQMGFILIVLAVSPKIDLYALNIFIFSHILYELCFFIVAAICNDYFKHDNIYKMQGFFHFKPLIGFLLLLASLNSLGFPFTSGFIGKILVSDIMVNTGNTFIYYFTFFSAAAHALHIGFKIFYMLYLKVPQQQNIENFKKDYISIVNILPICILLLITVVHYIMLSIFIPSINNLENIYHEVRVAIIGIIMFAFLVRFTNHDRELAIYEVNHTIIRISYSLLFTIVNKVRLFYSTVTNSTVKLVTRIVKSILVIPKIYYNSRVILFILFTIIFFTILLLLF